MTRAACNSLSRLLDGETMQFSNWKIDAGKVRMIFKVIHMRGTVRVLAPIIHSIILARYILRLEILLGSQKLDRIIDLRTEKPTTRF